MTSADHGPPSRSARTLQDWWSGLGEEEHRRWLDLPSGRPIVGALVPGLTEAGILVTGSYWPAISSGPDGWEPGEEFWAFLDSRREQPADPR